MVKDELHEQPDSSWVLLRVEDLLSRGNESAWRSLLVEDDKGFLDVVEAGLLGPCLSIQALGDVQLGMVEMQDRTQEDASSDLVEEVLGGQLGAPDVEGVEPSDEEALLELGDLRLLLACCA